MLKPNCSHWLACQYAKMLVENPNGESRTRRIYWCHKCGALAILDKDRGGPNKGEWQLPVGDK